MSSCPGPKMGTWWTRSKIDPRWNNEGKGCGSVTSGGPDEIYTWLELAGYRYGQKPPDLEIGFMKD